MRITAPPFSAKEKALLMRAMIRSKGLKARRSEDKPAPSIKKVREYDATIGVKIPRRTKRGFNGCKLSPEKRALIELRRSGRAAFFASLGVVV